MLGTGVRLHDSSRSRRLDAGCSVCPVEQMDQRGAALLAQPRSKRCGIHEMDAGVLYQITELEKVRASIQGKGDEVA